MNKNPVVENDMDSLNGMLAAALLQNQQLLARLERSHRMLLLLIAFPGVGMLAGGYSLLGSPAAHAADQGIAQRLEQDIHNGVQDARRWEQNDAAKLQSFELRSKAEFDKTIEKVRADLAKPVTSNRCRPSPSFSRT